MSNFLAVATVTAALQQLLQTPLGADVPGATVTTERPDLAKSTDGPITNLFLYQVIADAAQRNSDLPTRRADGTLVQRPRAAIDLHYLITFYGDDAELEPQRMLGTVVRTLHAQPTITSDLIAAVVTAATDPVPVHPSLATTDLAEADEVVHVTPSALDLEQLSKLWSVMFQTPYALSTAYHASPVLIEQQHVASPSLPVLTPAISVAPSSRPRIDRAVDATDASAPITATSTLRIIGSQLVGGATIVTVGGVTLVPSAVTQEFIDVALAGAPAGALRAGTLLVVVVHERLVGTPPSPRGAIESNGVAISLHPGVKSAQVAATVITVQSDVTIGAAQSVVIQLLDRPTGAVHVVLAVADRTTETSTVTASTTGVTPATYGVVLVVDGVSSPVQRDASGGVTSPTVVVP